MILDSSAVVAIFFREPEHESLLDKIDRVSTLGIGSPTLTETSIVLSARLRRDARPFLSRFLDEADATVIPFTDAHANTAVGAWLQFGKGRHPASLNLGDCLTYATARLAEQPLLCTGEDFRRTDLAVA